jgi:hypothetical protein
MVAATLLGFHIRMRECGAAPELGQGQWFMDVTEFLFVIFMARDWG